MATRARRPLLHYSKAAALPRSAPTFPPLRLAGALGLIFVFAGVLLLVLDLLRSPSPAPVPGAAEYLVLAEFGPSADTVYRVDPARPSRRSRLLRVPHAPEYGMIASASPDGRAFAYTVLPPETPAPAPDTPAELWTASMDGTAPRRLGVAFDLRVRPLWSPDGSSLVVRRSGSAIDPPAGTEGPYELVQVRVPDGAASVLARSEVALFPAGFSPDGRTFYYAAVSRAGSDLYGVDTVALTGAPVARLSDDLTRDWALSPDGSRLAFLTLTPDGPRSRSQVQVLELATGALAAVGEAGDEFGPAWTPSGGLTLGALRGGAGAVLLDGEVLGSRPRGFDVPLSWSRSGARVAARSFDGPSATSPGLASLVVIGRDGQRRTIAQGEVTFIGWTYR
ncbi:MAG TPA: hypothetical protein VNN10_14865 [Dehalococcoidia bacterium]|nr:hypothetical protein [Dehalococcoidia bacterium]